MKHIILLFISLLPLTLVAQLDREIEDDWTLVENEDNIRIFTRLSDSTNLKELRIFVEMKGNVDTLIHIINDAENFGDWVYKCSKSAPIAIPDGYQSAYIATTDFPFPLCDREIVAKSKQWVDEEGRFITHGICAFDSIPINQDIVRISHYESRWQIEELKNHKIFIDYQSSVDPGGRIPNWITNLAITTGPLKTFAKLSELVEKRSNF